MPISERLAEIERESRSERSSISVSALRILGLLAEHHFVAIVAGLEQRDAGAAELRDLAAELQQLTGPDATR